MDDAFQHIRLERDVDLVLLDAEKPFGNGRLLPRGVLREEKQSLERCSAVVLTRAGEHAGPAMKAIACYTKGKPVFRCDHRPYIAAVVSGEKRNGAGRTVRANRSVLDAIKGCRGYLFSAIADNRRFRRTMEQAGCRICGSAFFPDHHRYSNTDFEAIMGAARSSNAELVLTTEKDYARFSAAATWPVDLVVVGVKIQFPDDSFDRYIKRMMENISAD